MLTMKIFLIGHVIDLWVHEILVESSYYSLTTCKAIPVYPAHLQGFIHVPVLVAYPVA